MQHFKQQTLDTAHSGHAVWLVFTFLLLLATLSPYACAQAPGTVVTLEWLHNMRNIVLKLELPADPQEDTPSHRLLIPTVYKDTLAISGYMKLARGFLYMLSPRQPRGRAQILIPEALKVTAFASDVPADAPPERKQELFGFAIHSYRGGQKKYKIFNGEKTQVYSQKSDFSRGFDGYSRAIALSLSEIHDSTVAGQLSGETVVTAFPAYTAGPLLAVEEVPLITYLRPLYQASKTAPSHNADPVQPPSALELMMRNMKLLSLQSRVPAELSKTVKANVLAGIALLYPEVAHKVLTLTPGTDSKTQLSTLAVPVIMMAQAFKDLNIPISSIPVLSGAHTRSSEEHEALEVVYRENLFLTPVAPPNDAKKTKDPSPKAKKNKELWKLESDLHSKLQKKESYDSELWTLLHGAFGPHKSFLLVDQSPEITQFPIVRRVTPMYHEGTTVPQHQLIIFQDLPELERTYMVMAIKRVLSRQNVSLPIPRHIAFWSGRSLHIPIIVFPDDTEQLSKKLTGSPHSLDTSRHFLRESLKALQTLYENGIYPSHINKFSIFVPSHNPLEPPFKVFFTAPPLSFCGPEETNCKVDASALITVHLEQLMMTYLELRTGVSLETIYLRKKQISPSDSSSIEEALSEWHLKPQKMWEEWLSSASAIADKEELAVIKMMAASPNEQTPTSVLRLFAPVTGTPTLAPALKAGRSKASHPVTQQALKVPLTHQTQLYKQEAEVIEAPDHHYLCCSNGHSLTLRKTKELATEYIGVAGVAGIRCDNFKCLDLQKEPPEQKPIKGEWVMHCSQCGMGMWGYDQCMESCVQQLGVPGLPQTVQCPSSHQMTLIPGIRDTNPTYTNLICDGRECKNQKPQKNLRGVHHYTCPDCYQRDKERGCVERGYDLCIDCAVNDALSISKPKGRHMHTLSSVYTRSHGRLCSQCKAENPVGQLRFSCQSCAQAKPPTHYSICKSCAAQELGWIGAGPPHPQTSK
ncbi:hypothetical protein [Sansalvadorimonas verongulae]|uniref:hypothetical protein n=1 Tax=Sansalvadorimonas verongulae TaxID=2172824 RepID=UPI0012BC1D37|nr:hypothetical protein [Sansalvadorimonas verongulae]MTI15357.1 hypothetical protein [Sansalvadorimonas verongulae]